MRYYSVVVIERGFPKITYGDDREPYITSTYANAQDHLLLCQESWPGLEYKIVWFDV